ncbi:MAG: hypothetical protein QOE23_689 [Pseudonocardiales bacterium]|jgi:hypothetical protein|nr:hypothetical protein [Pseudonocardiales bacterium]
MPVVTGVFTADFSLAREFSGQHLMAVVRHIAGDAYYESYFYRNGNCYSLGCKSEDLDRNLRVAWFSSTGAWATYWIPERIYPPRCHIAVTHFDWDREDATEIPGLGENDRRKEIARDCFAFFEELRAQL